ncbi:MAG: hypothetical protein ACM3OO_07440 [Planctomycetaceae bacterium]
MRARVPVLLAATLTAVLTVAPAHALPGDLDPAFSGDGIATQFPNGAVGTAVAVDAEGHVVVVGYTVGGGVDVAVARFSRDGTPDPTFGGGDGRVRLDLGAADYAFDVAVDGEGGLAIAGERSTGDGSTGFVLRLGPRGVPAARFGGGDGVASVSFGKPFQGLDAVAFTPKDRIVVGGYSSNGSLSRSTLARLMPDGRRDRGFSDDGLFSTDLSASGEQVNDVAVLPDGSVLAAGYAEVGLQPAFSLFRVRGDGTLATGFGDGDGSTLTDVSTGADVANALTVDPEGRIVLAGSASDGGLGDWGVARFGAGGRLDRTFGTDGVALVRFGSGPDQANDIVAWGARLLLTGDAHGGAGGDVVVVRLKAGGALDPSFAGDGKARIDVAGGADDGAGIALLPSGKIAVGGSAVVSGAYRVLAIRLQNGT